MEKFDKNKVWGDIKKYYTLQSVVVLVLVVIIFSIVIPKVIPPSREAVESRRDEIREIMNSSYDRGFAQGKQEGIIEGKKTIYNEVILRMLIAGMKYGEIYSLVKPDRLLVNFDQIKDELEVMSDKQIIELKNINIIELQSLRTLFQKEVKE